MVMKTALVATAALMLATVHVQAQSEDQAQLVLISGISTSGDNGSDVINKVTRVMPTMQECVEAGKDWVRMKDAAPRNGWRKYECYQGF